MKELSGWNYRVVRKGEKGNYYFQIHEVYYAKTKKGIEINGWSVDPMIVHGIDNITDLKVTLRYMNQALKRPILELVKKGKKEFLKDILCPKKK